MRRYHDSRILKIEALEAKAREEMEYGNEYKTNLEG